MQEHLRESLKRTWFRPDNPQEWQRQGPSDTVYVFGAGVNKSLRNKDRTVAPPLARDLFQVSAKVLGTPRTRKVQKTPTRGVLSREHRSLEPVYKYIEHYWKLSEADLVRRPFDLEACFTFLERQINDAQAAHDQTAIGTLFDIRFRLIMHVAGTLSDFHFMFNAGFEGPFVRLAERVYGEQSTVITFNYDTLFESAIESASHINPEAYQHPGEEAKYSHSNWNRPLGYGVRFDDVQLKVAGIPRFLDASEFYADGNDLYAWPLLKLHGSINWFRYTPISSRPVIPGIMEAEPFPPDYRDRLVFYDTPWWGGRPPDLGGWFLDPLLIPPVTDKSVYINATARIFETLWQQARAALMSSKRLVVIGYSFPPTDFLTHQLFREAFADHQPEEVIVVNPSASPAQTVGELTHVKPARVRNLETFLG